ncbi:hypothetical protein [Pseudonocardia nigra]|uniref:hypothetical protein n=1 Tax=Pseudonocardia nigra TaxID=1921578 RepID=UPI001C5DA1CB|nr:hypothetical protein [Pseudonocardia nigra]
MWAGIVLLTVVAQVLLGVFARGMPELGMVHGVLAIALFAFAVIAAKHAEAAIRAEHPTAARGTADV